MLQQNNNNNRNNNKSNNKNKATKTTARKIENYLLERRQKGTIHTETFGKLLLPNA